MIAPVAKFGLVRLSTNFPSKQIWRRIPTWKEDEFLVSEGWEGFTEPSNSLLEYHWNDSQKISNSNTVFSSFVY